jgi:GTP1/Obg family GTP-binding protein
MDHLQYSPNQKLYRGNIIQNPNQNYTSYNNNLNYIPYSYDEQLEYQNVNNIPNQNHQQIFIKTSHEENKRATLPRNQHAHSIDNNSNMSQLLNTLNEELEIILHSNNQLTAEIEKIESNHSNLIASRIHYVDEVIEKKTSLLLLKKEIEVKRGYLNSLLRIKKNRIEEIQKTKTTRLVKIIDNINESTEILNEAASDLKHFQELPLQFLDAVNKEIVLDLVKIC